MTTKVIVEVPSSADYKVAVDCFSSPEADANTVYVSAGEKHEFYFYGRGHIEIFEIHELADL